MRIRLQLTPEQLNIVKHHQGAAIVYAVAGAGKSTTMAHRVRHLVQQHQVKPQRILVCSFSKATVSDIEQKIQGLGITGAACYTFNALGRKIVQKTVQEGYWPPFNEELIEHRNSQLAMQALVALSKQQGKNFSKLDINQEDLQNYVSISKGNLCYADLLAAQLPAHTHHLAQQAQHANTHYLTAYKLYEKIRQQHRWLTFDDQLVLAWEALERFEAIRTWAKASFDFLLVDEFQDINKVQAQIADILTESHRNYMAIGDDDQCIYEWRGANVRYILDFKQRYHAAEYVILDNFRCPAEATLLAGKIIAKNKARHAKNLVSQKGFGGHVALKGLAHEGAVAQYVVEEYRRLLTTGLTPQDCIVLVRSYSQTAVIEARLIEANLPYQVIGSQRFYERPEVRILFTYLALARQEKDYQQAQQMVMSEQYLRRFADVLRQPNRYLSQQWIDDFIRQGKYRGGSLLAFLEIQLQHIPNATTKKCLQVLWQVLHQLQHKLHDEVGGTLVWLINKLDYLDSLKKSAATPELGEERCQNVHALINYAQKKGTVLAFLEHLRGLYLADTQQTDNKAKLHIMSIHRAKGLEWPVVFVPCCSHTQLPSVYNNNIEEERRLLYVALTRTKQYLYVLYAPQKTGMSVFLREVDAKKIMADALQLQAIFNTQAMSDLRSQDVLFVAKALQHYPLERYIHYWWHKDNVTARAIWQQKIASIEQEYQLH
jgi:DNA helicase-2/ATP-dependent DNA helicase PcrA